jgi:hypothetical protein
MKRPISVTIVAWVYIVTGVGGFVTHLIQAFSGSGFQVDVVEAEFVELLAIVCGVFILRGRNWARWLALGWMGFHVIVSGFSSLREFAVHAVFFAAIARCLFGREAAEYFRGDEISRD